MNVGDDDALVTLEDFERALLHAVEIGDIEEIDRMLDLMRLAADAMGEEAAAS